jgi:hypothetical protein
MASRRIDELADVHSVVDPYPRLGGLIETATRT